MANTPIKSNLNFSELDFANIKASLKEFLKQQTTLQDYDFDGSMATVLLDVLSYNTQYNAFYLNMVAGEMFLDSAQRRDNVVSRAKSVGYVPRSVRAPVANLRLNFSAPSATQVAPGLVFTSTVDGVSYTFVTIASFYPTSPFSDVQVYAGTPVVNEYTFKDGDTGYTIPNAGIDTSTLVVSVDAGSGFIPYFLPSEINTLNEDSNVFFLEETDGEKFRVYFGQGLIGKQLVLGNIVRVEYVASAGVEANGAATFNLQGSLPNLTSITVLQAAVGGAEIESIESIKLKAPQIYETQNRAVTAKDYQLLLQRDYSFIQSVKVWGGEDNNPVRLGYVFASIKPIDGYTLTQVQKDLIVSDLKTKYSVVTIEPVIVDPDFVFIIIDSLVKYDVSLASSASVVENKAQAAIEAFGDSELSDFGQYFRHSVLAALIDGADLSITNNVTNVVIQKREYIDQTGDYDYRINYSNPLEVGSLTSSLFDYRADGFVDSVSITNGGTLYNSPIAITSSGAGGAVGTATHAAGVINSVTITVAGRTKAPAVYAVDVAGGGTGAILSPIISNGVITGVTRISGGTGYTDAVKIQILSGLGTGTEITATQTAGVIDNTFTVVSGGSGYVSLPTITATGASAGSGAVLTPIIRYNAQVVGATVTNAGTGYTAAPAVSVSATGREAKGTAAINIGTGLVTSISVTDAGYGYKEPPFVTLTGGGGSGALAVPVMSSIYSNCLFKDERGNQFAYSRAGTTVTATRVSHGLKKGEFLPVFNSTDLLMDNATGYQITSIVTPDTFTFEVPGTVVGPSVGNFGKSEEFGFVGLNQRNDTLTRTLISNFSLVDYILGTYTLNDFNVDAIVTYPSLGEIRFNATPQEEDVVPKLNQILIIDPDDINVNAQVDVV